MAKTFQVDFHIPNLTLLEQEKIYQYLIEGLDYNQRENLQITITDPSGGKHFVWDKKGATPEKYICDVCYEIDCAKCKTYERLCAEYEGKEI